ncbi:pyridoxamine 5'-phosphate oxidase family protein [Bacterioplanoides pacificum]|uniref:Pyridoxamine 5'-phosphate oxidase family protein n=1 Tax=Bacterioplanoides pacificum TaxID=1171596 RepID=A0ABV7VUJ2_9GAMM
MQNTPDPIRNEVELRQHIAAYPSILDQRIQTRLDDLCLEFIHASQLIMGFYQAQDQADFFILPTDQLMIQSPEQLQLSAVSLPSASVSLIFLIAGVDHVLRINGQLTESGRLHIQQSYFHCGRAAMRARLWQPETVSATITPADFIHRARYALLASFGADGKVLISPRGEQAGQIQLLADGKLLLPERPGNKVAASLRNLLTDPRIRLALIIPGCERVLCVQGMARISAAAEKRQQAAVDNRPAKLVIEIADVRTHWLNNSALDATFWQLSEQPVSGLTPFAKALATHMKGKGMMGKLTHLVVDRVVKKDANNLY